MSSAILAVAECLQIWDASHKIKISSRESSNAQEVSLTAREVHTQIVNYVIAHSPEVKPSRSEIKVEAYHPNGSFVSLLDLTMEGNAREIFGKRIRCIITIQGNYSANQVANTKASSEPLLIKGRFYEYNPNGMNFSGKNLVIKEEVNNREEDGTGLNVWDGSLLLARYLEKNPEKVKEKTALELGSGPAVVGIAAALLGAKQVILSDLEYTLPLMRSNVKLNQNVIDPAVFERVQCMEIDWFNPPDIQSLSTSIDAPHEIFPDVMLVADCVWLEELVNPLMNTIDKLCRTHTEVIITYQRRGKAAHDLFMNRISDIFSFVDNVDTMDRCGVAKPESISLLICRR